MELLTAINCWSLLTAGDRESDRVDSTETDSVVLCYSATELGQTGQVSRP